MEILLSIGTGESGRVVQHDDDRHIICLAVLAPNPHALYTENAQAGFLSLSLSGLHELIRSIT